MSDNTWPPDRIRQLYAEYKRRNPEDFAEPRKVDWAFMAVAALFGIFFATCVPGTNVFWCTGAGIAAAIASLFLKPDNTTTSSKPHE